MEKNISWETLVSILFLVIITSIVIISTLKIIEYDDNLNYEYDKVNYISILEKNSNLIANKIDYLNFLENETLYIYKSWNTIQAFSWIENQDYKYINYLWEHVNSWSYNWTIYERECLIKENDIEWKKIECLIKELIKK